MSNQFPQLVATNILQEYGIRMTSTELKMLVEAKIGTEIPDKRWNQVIAKLQQYTGMIDVE